MPKMLLHAPQGTFTSDARAAVAAALTDLGISCEMLADTAKVRAGVWVFFLEHAADCAFRGGQVSQSPIMSLIVYTLEGGMNADAKKRMIVGATAILAKHTELRGEQPPVHVMILEVPEISWGMYGNQVKLADLRGV